MVVHQVKPRFQISNGVGFCSPTDQLDFPPH